MICFSYYFPFVFVGTQLLRFFKLLAKEYKIV